MGKMLRWRGMALFLLWLGLWPACAVAADKPTYILINAGAGRVDFAEQNAQHQRDGSVTLSILTVLASGKVAYAMSDISLNCAASTFAALGNVNYDAHGQVLPSDPTDASPIKIQAGTVGQSLKLFICDGADPYPRAKMLDGVPAAISKAHDLIDAMQKGN
jgi:hypothetical protein